MKKLIPSILIFNTFLAAEEISEKQIIDLALLNNKDIQILKCDHLNDSLGLELEKCGWIPKINLQFIPSLSRSKQFPTLDSSSASDFNLNAEAYFAQFLPGGAQFISQLSASSINSFLLKNQHINSGSASFSISQPLLKNSFKFSNPSYQIRLKKMDNAMLSMERKKSLLSQISNIRTLFWDIYEQKLNSEIYNQDLQINQLNLLNEKTRLTVGESGTLDTLNALIKVLTAKQSLLESQINAQNTLDRLAFALSITPDSFNITYNIDIDIPHLPDPSILIPLIEKFDPSLKVFEVMAEKILLQYKKSKNDRLPSLKISATLDHTLSSDLIYSNHKKTNAVLECIFTYSFPLKESLISEKILTFQSQKDKLQEKKYREDLAIKLRILQQSWDKELQKIAMAEKICQLSEQQLLIAQKSYELGTIDRLTLTDAQKGLTESKLEVIRLKINLKRLQIIVDEMTGTILNRFNFVID